MMLLSLSFKTISGHPKLFELFSQRTPTGDLKIAFSESSGKFVDSSIDTLTLWDNRVISENIEQIHRATLNTAFQSFSYERINKLPYRQTRLLTLRFLRISSQIFPTVKFSLPAFPVREIQLSISRQDLIRCFRPARRAIQFTRRDLRLCQGDERKSEI